MKTVQRRGRSRILKQPESFVRGEWIPLLCASFALFASQRCIPSLNFVIRVRRIFALYLLAGIVLFASNPLQSYSYARNGRHETSRTGSPEPVQMEKYVLQVGINKYLHVPNLEGCLNDLANMKKVLTEKFEVPVDHIKSLTDGEATHEAIIAAFMSQLIENAKKHPNSLVVFQYSGHGSRVPDQNGDKEDHLDSTIVPVDSRDRAGKHFDIVDDEIRDLFDELSPYTANIVFIFDSCHSGNPTRGGDQPREIPMDTRPQPGERELLHTASVNLLRGRDMVGLLPRDERYISIAATQPNELAMEIEVDGQQEGALTHYLVCHLENARPETTYREMMAGVADDVNVKSAGQHPQCEGDKQRYVLAGSANREDTFIKLNKIAGREITISAGAAQGMTEGTVLSIYSPDAHQLIGMEKRLAMAKVTRITDLTATAELSEERKIPVNAKVVVLSRDFGSTRTRALLDPKIPSDIYTETDKKVMAEVAEWLDGYKSVAIVREPVDGGAKRPRADVVLMRGRFGSVFKDKANLAPGPDGNVSTIPDDARVLYLTGPDRTTPLFGFAVQDRNEDAPRRIADAIAHLANQRALRAVNNAVSSLNGQLVLKVIKVMGKRNADGGLEPGSHEKPVVLGKMDQDYLFDQGEMFKFQIENHSPRDLYINLFDISTDGAIQILYPPTGKAVLIKSKDKVPLVIPQVFATTGPAGVETFKMIATTIRTSHDDFAFLEQGAVRGTKSIPVAIPDIPDWTTTQINFVISNRVSK